MQTEIRAGAVLDVLTQDELRTVLEEISSGFLRDPYRVRLFGGGETDDAGSLVFDVTSGGKARPGFQLLINRLVIVPTGYTFAAPYEPMDQGAVEMFRSPGPGSVLGDLVDGNPFGGGSGGSLPTVYTVGDDRSVDLLDQEVLQLRITGGPVSTVITVIGHGTMIPLPDEAAY